MSIINKIIGINKVQSIPIPNRVASKVKFISIFIFIIKLSGQCIHSSLAPGSVSCGSAGRLSVASEKGKGLKATFKCDVWSLPHSVPLFFDLFESELSQPSWDAAKPPAKFLLMWNLAALTLTDGRPLCGIHLSRPASDDVKPALLTPQTIALFTSSPWIQLSDQTLSLSLTEPHPHKWWSKQKLGHQLLQRLLFPQR